MTKEELKRAIQSHEDKLRHLKNELAEYAKRDVPVTHLFCRYIPERLGFVLVLELPDGTEGFVPINDKPF